MNSVCKEYMLDNFFAKGESLDEYRKIAAVVDENTEMVYADPSCMNILHLMSIGKGHLTFLKLTPGDCFNRINDSVTVGEDIVLNVEKPKQKFPEFIDEIIDTNNTIFMRERADNKEIFFIGNTFFKSFSSKFEDFKGKFWNNSTLERDIALSSIFYENNVKIYFLTRRMGRVRKAMAAYTERYKRVPYMFLADTVESFTNFTVSYWKISQRTAEIYIEATDACVNNSPIIPGINLVTSDTAYKQTCVQACFRNKNGKAENHYILKEYDCKHSTQITVEDMINYINAALEEQDRFLSKFLYSRNHLMRERIDSKSAYDKTIKELMTAADMIKSIGIKGQRALIQYLQDHYCDEKTKADAFDKVIELPDKFSGLSNNQREHFRGVLVKLVDSVA